MLRYPQSLWNCLWITCVKEPTAHTAYGLQRTDHFSTNILSQHYPVAVSLLAIASAPSTLTWLTHRYREQAHSYKRAALLECAAYPAIPQRTP
jgi:hypothetical protein